jgi:hypothetical protein
VLEECHDLSVRRWQPSDGAHDDGDPLAPLDPAVRTGLVRRPRLGNDQGTCLEVALPEDTVRRVPNDPPEPAREGRRIAEGE